MPRGPRLDAPGVLHHVMVRGIERRAIFRDDRDRTDFVQRAAALAHAGAWSVLAWALLPNHAHLLVRTAQRPLAAAMPALLTGYAGAFNRRHKRRGHLFQNRYQSILVEEDRPQPAPRAGPRPLAGGGGGHRGPWATCEM